MESGTSHETERNPDSVSVRKFQHYQRVCEKNSVNKILL